MRKTSSVARQEHGAMKILIPWYAFPLIHQLSAVPSANQIRRFRLMNDTGSESVGTSKKLGAGE